MATKTEQATAERLRLQLSENPEDEDVTFTVTYAELKRLAEDDIPTKIKAKARIQLDHLIGKRYAWKKLVTQHLGVAKILSKSHGDS